MTRARDGDARIRQLFAVHRTVAEAGVISHGALKARVRQALGEVEPTFAVTLSRDLAALVAAGVLEKAGAGRRAWFRLADPDAIVLGPTMAALDAEGRAAFEADDRRPARDAAVRSRRLRAALADLEAAGGHGGPGGALVRLLRERLDWRAGGDARDGMFAYRAWLPGFGAGGPAVSEDVWDDLITAIAERRQVRLELAGSFARSRREVLHPRRIVWFNGRARLEAWARRAGVRRVVYVPLFRIGRVERLSAEAEPPTPAEATAVAGQWGLDAGDRALHQPLGEQIVGVSLRFFGAAISPVEEDPGHPGARLAREKHQGRAVLRYEVEVVPGPYFTRWVRGFGPDVEVLAPASLRAEIARDARATAARYADDPP